MKEKEHITQGKDIVGLFHFEIQQQEHVVLDHNLDRWAGEEIHDGMSVWTCVCVLV